MELLFARELEQGKTKLRLDLELFGSECGSVSMKQKGVNIWDGM